jgi:predicted Fe-S protein YdhL (DUF1289 family)
MHMSIASPCISVCKMSPELAQRAGCAAQSGGLCTGCFRTLEEIMDWGTATDTRKREVWLQLKTRAENAGERFPLNIE